VSRHAPAPRVLYRPPCCARPAQCPAPQGSVPSRVPPGADRVCCRARSRLPPPYGAAGGLRRAAAGGGGYEIPVPRHAGTLPRHATGAAGSRHRLRGGIFRRRARLFLRLRCADRRLHRRIRRGGGACFRRPRSANR